MTIQVVEQAVSRVRCPCGALLSFNPGDEQRCPSPPHLLATHPRATMGGGWPWIPCPQCHRAVMVSGCW